MSNFFRALFGSVSLLIVSLIFTFFGVDNMDASVKFALPHVVAILLVGAFYWRFCRMRNPYVLKHVLTKQVAFIHFGLMFALYAVWAMFFPSESFVDDFFNGTNEQNALKLLTVFILAPISEELTYRGVMFESISNIKHNKFMLIVAAIISSSVFILYHSQYEYFSTSVLLFFVGMILCSARYFSGTLWFSIVLHSFASLCVLLF